MERGLTSGARQVAFPGGNLGCGYRGEGGEDGGEIGQAASAGGGAEFGDGAASAEEEEGFAAVGHAVDAIGEITGGFGQGKGLRDHHWAEAKMKRRWAKGKQNTKNQKI